MLARNPGCVMGRPIAWASQDGVFGEGTGGQLPNSVDNRPLSPKHRVVHPIEVMIDLFRKTLLWPWTGPHDNTPPFDSFYRSR